MAKRKRATTAKVIARRMKEGRGEGTGSSYRPWLTIQDVPSKGLVSRTQGWATGRIHHTLSQLETAYLMVLEWLNVTDIREQFPLDRDQTLAIAEHLGFKHPTDPQTGEPAIMTTDFVVTVKSDLGEYQYGRTVKYANDLEKKRTLQKLEIERQYWTQKGMDWSIVTDRDIPWELAKNVEWLHPYRDLSSLPLKPKNAKCVAAYMTPLVLKGDRSLAEIAANADDRLGLEPGTGLSVARYLLANRVWTVDMYQAIEPRKPLTLVATALKDSISWGFAVNH